MRIIIVMTIAMIVAGCDSVEGGGETTPKITNATVTPGTLEGYKYPKDTEWTYVELNLDDMPFEDAFKIQYLAHGEGHVFWWRGNEYTTNLHTGNITTATKWVNNSDDLDDECYSNEWDICGQCDGPGMITWYRDADGDGLGDATHRVLDCNYPSVDSE